MPKRKTLLRQIRDDLRDVKGLLRRPSRDRPKPQDPKQDGRTEVRGD